MSWGYVRTNASVLVDGRLLIDCGPEAPRQASRAGVELAGVRWESWENARARARHEGKPILLFDMVGRLDERWC